MKRCKEDSNTACNVKYLGFLDNQKLRIEADKGKLFESRRMEVRLRDIYLPRKQSSDECEKEMATKVESYLNRTIENADQLHLANLRRRLNFELNADLFADGKRVNDLLYVDQLVLANGDGRSWCDLKEEASKIEKASHSKPTETTME